MLRKTLRVIPIFMTATLVMVGCASAQPTEGVDALRGFDLSSIDPIQPYVSTEFQNFENVLAFDSAQKVIGEIVSFGPPEIGSFDDVFEVVFVPVTVRVHDSVPVMNESNFVFRVILNFDSSPKLENLTVGDKILYLGDTVYLDDTGWMAGTPSWVYVVDEGGSLIATDGYEEVRPGNLLDSLSALGFKDEQSVEAFLTN